MVSNFDSNSLRSIAPEGKRHYQTGKKTSLYGSESPKNEKRSMKPKSENNIFGNGEIYNQKSSINESKKINSDMEKRATLLELQQYNPWGKPGCGAPNNNNSNVNNLNNRSKWELDQNLKGREETNSKSNEQFPGFNGGFGSGKTPINNRRRSDASQNNEPKREYSSYNNDNIVNGHTNSTSSQPVNEDDDDTAYRKYEETKALADNLEKEIQRLKLQQLEDKYEMMKNDQQNHNYGSYQDEVDKSSLNYEDDALYKEAENRARLREIDRLREAYEQQQQQQFTENESFSNEIHDQTHLNGQKYSNQTHFSDGSNQKNAKKDVTNNRNDYRQYTAEEYLNCRPQLVNPSMNKRTTLSGSEERRNYNESSNNGNMQLIDEDNIIRKFSNTNTHNNLFPSQRDFSSGKASAPYQMKAPYATD